VSFLIGVLRVYSWVFEALLCLAAIAFGIAGFVTGGGIALGWLPWSGNALLAWTAAIGILGLLFVLLAVRGRLRILLFLFSLAVAVLLVKGLFLGPYAFGGPGQAEKAVYLAAAAVVAFVGAWPAGGATAKR
jgi:hypothetical protein